LSKKQSTLFPNTSDALNVLQGLDRAEVEPLAFKILEAIEPYCVRVEVAGSFRRQKQTVNDLDIVVQLKPLPLYWLQIIKLIRSEFNALTVKQGDKLATLNVPFASKQGQGYVQVDFYRADPNTWGILLLARTGSKEHNVKLCNLAISKGLRLQYSVGLTDKYGNVVAGRTEEEVFQGLGLDYIQPKDREV
jgi:DNA polymerase (family 10)